jgi:hypothetical protein
MGALLRTIGVSIVTMVAGYAMKRLMSSIEKQAETARQQADNARQPQDSKELKTLKQDPVTGVYYAED